MNYLNDLLKQGRDLVLSMPPSSRLMAILLTIAIVVSAGFLVVGTSGTKMVYIFDSRDFSEEELMHAEGALGAAGLNDYERVGRRLKVPFSSRDAYLKALDKAKAVPADLGSHVAAALNGNNFLEPMSTSASRLLDAKQRDVGARVGRLAYVEYASVTFSEEERGFSKDRHKVVSVVVMPKNRSSPLTDTQMQSILRLVRHSFAGVKDDDIAVVDLSNSSGTPLVGSSNPIDRDQQQYAARKRQIEVGIRDQAIRMLSDYGDVKVEVNVDLDSTLRKATETRKIDPQATTISASETKKESETPRPSPSGRPGAEPNAGPNQARQLAATTETSTKTKETQSNEQKTVGQERTLVENAGLLPIHGRISVAYPYSYLKTASMHKWQSLNPGKASSEAPAMTKNEIVEMQIEVEQKIQKMLVALLPTESPGKNILPNITVTDYIDMPADPIPGPSLAETALAWLSGSWKTLALIGIALFALLSLRSFVKFTPKTEDREFAQGFGLSIDDALTNEDQEAAHDAGKVEQSDETAESGELGNRERRFQISGGEIKEDLTALVRQNPDAAVNLLRTWIGDAA